MTFSQVQRELTLNCPEPISVTDEDKQLINGKEDRGKAAKQETIGGLTQTTNITHKPTVLILESISYFLMFHEYRTSIHSFDRDTLRIGYAPNAFNKAESKKNNFLLRKYYDITY